jgi:hypothetical protein
MMLANTVWDQGELARICRASSCVQLAMAFLHTGSMANIDTAEQRNKYNNFLDRDFINTSSFG